MCQKNIGKVQSRHANLCIGKVQPRHVAALAVIFLVMFDHHIVFQ